MSSGPSRGRAGFGKCRACVCGVDGGGVLDGGVVAARARAREMDRHHVISSISISISTERRKTANSEQGRTYVVVPGHVKGGDDGDAGEGDERERERGGEGTRGEAEHGCRCTTESV